MILFSNNLIILILTNSYFVVNAPVGKKKNEQKEVISERLSTYISKIQRELENSTEFIQHLSEQIENNHTNVNANFSLISEGVLERLHELKRQTKLELLNLRNHQDSYVRSGLKFLPKDFIDILDAGHPNKFSNDDIQKIISKISDVEEAVENAEVTIMKEHEIDEVLTRWEKLQHELPEVRKKHIEEFNEEQRKHIPIEKIHHPGSLAQEKESWVDEDEMDESQFSPFSFFQKHDLNSDKYLDREELGAMFLPQLKKALPKDKLERERQKHSMVKSVLDDMDINQDGRISLEEHAAYTSSREAEKDEPWEDDDPIDKIAAEANPRDMKTLEDELNRLKSIDSKSPTIKLMKEKLEHLRKGLNVSN